RRTDEHDGRKRAGEDPLTRLPVSPAVGAVLLAAGESSRMGRSKQTLDWGGRTLLEYQIRTLVEAGVSELVVVFGHRAEKFVPIARTVRDELKPAKIHFVVNSSYADGKSTSIRAGVHALPASCDVLIASVDQPRRVDTYRELLSQHEGSDAKVSIASYTGRRGHPPLFSRSLRSELASVDEESEGLRSVIARHADSIRLVDVADPLVTTNLNTPADYEAAKALFEAGPGS
ncbi:MAG: nucleotidyltransferase family protein, partial [Planctomycetota bacterium]